MKVKLKIKEALTLIKILEFKELTIDIETKSIFIGDEKLDLNEKLYSLLEYLVINKGLLLFKEQIFNKED